MDITIEDADKLYLKANKKLDSFTLFGNKYEYALNLLEESLSKFKMLKSHDNVAKVALKMSMIYIVLKNNCEAAKYNVEAYMAYKYNIAISEVQFELAVTCLEKAIELYKNNGNNGMVSKYYKELGDIHEIIYKNKAIEYYYNAIDYNNFEDDIFRNNECKLKIAYLYLQLYKYEYAADTYEDVIKNYINNNCFKRYIKSLFIKAGICRMIHFNSKQMYDKINEYKKLDTTFEKYNECNFLLDLTKAIELSNSNKFSAIITDNSTTIKLDKLILNILSTIKNKIKLSNIYEDDNIINDTY